jgi:hypothetical protein
MMPVSYRLSWATRGSGQHTPFVLGVVAAVLPIAATLNAVGAAGEWVGFWCAGAIVAGLIVLDFPGAGASNGSEFELSLPLSVYAMIEARLAWSLAFWLAPPLVALGLCAAGLLAAPPWPLALGAMLAATGTIGLAAVVREALALSATWQRRTVAVRAAVLLVAAPGFLWPATWVGPLALVGALWLLRATYRRAPAALELRLVGGVAAGATASARAERGVSVRGLFWRYNVFNVYVVVLLAGIAAFSCMIELSDTLSMQAVVIAQWPGFLVGWSARLFRLESLPLDRDRLFRFALWPSLICMALGLVAALAVGLPETFATLDKGGIWSPGPVTLHSFNRHWRFTLEQAPLVQGPHGESYRPALRRFGLGSAVFAYDPYETGPGTSRDLRIYQLGRLLSEQHGLTLTPQELDVRLRSMGWDDTLTLDHFPELRGERRREAVVRFALLGLAALAWCHVNTRSRAFARAAGVRLPRTARGKVAAALTLLFFIGIFVPTLLTLGEVDVPHMFLGPLVSYAAQHFVPALALAVALGALLYRSLQRRFRRMEPPTRVFAYVDKWFIEI